MNRQKLAAISIFKRNQALKENGILESVSGQGSSVSAASALLEALPIIFDRHNIKKICDCPCGDHHWMKLVKMEGIEYVGLDVVEDLIAANQKSFPERTFRTFDAISEIPPRCDLIICRDFLFHLHFDEGIAVLRNFQSSGSRLILTTSFNNVSHNTDIAPEASYGFRKINMAKSPYCLGEPIQAVHEFEDRYLNLYYLK